jgi:hypothetical protein
MMIYSYIYHHQQARGKHMGNLRTIITISEDDKIWLESYSKTSGISVAEAIRRGISQLKEQEEKNIFQMLIEETRGIWSKEDGLDYQNKLRAEWR